MLALSAAAAASESSPPSFTLNGTCVVPPVPTISFDDIISIPTDHAAPAPVRRCAPEPLDPLVELPLPLSIVLAVGEIPSFTGSASIGSPQGGALWSGVELVDSDDIGHGGAYRWGTASTVRAIERAAREVRRCNQDSPRLVVGDLSRRHGGELEPHHSHQSGLDADIGYFFGDAPVRWGKVTPSTFDAPRTWTLVRALIEGGNVEVIFMDDGVRRRLQAYVATLDPIERPVLPDDAPWTSLVHHEPGHDAHLHVRFRDPAAVGLGERIVRAWPGVLKTTLSSG